MTGLQAKGALVNERTIIVLTLAVLEAATDTWKTTCVGVPKVVWRPRSGSDISCAFPNANLPEGKKIYMSIPDGAEIYFKGKDLSNQYFEICKAKLCKSN